MYMENTYTTAFWTSASKKSEQCCTNLTVFPYTLTNIENIISHLETASIDSAVRCHIK